MQTLSSPRRHALRRYALRQCAPQLMATLLVALASLHALPASAQTVYRNVGPDGRITFSDRPSNQAPAPSAASGQASADPAPQAQTQTGTAGNSALPYALRQTASRFPVVVYTAKDCAPCDSARQLLQSRGIPYAERTVQTEADAAALRKLSGQDSLPFATIGKQHLAGFSSSEWTQYLNAAGYPASSQLPAQYSQPAPQPLTTPKPPEPVAAPADAAGTQRAAPSQSLPQPAAPGRRTGDNPAGLTF